MKYTFDRSNHFFTEVVDFSIVFLAMQGLWAYWRALHEIDRAVTWSYFPQPRPQLTLAKVTIPDLQEGIGMLVRCTLTNASDLIEPLRQSRTIEVVEYVDESLMPPDISPSDALPVMKLPPELLTLAAQSALNSAYERVVTELDRRWSPKSA